jgi:hypothetical protein
VQDTGAWSSEHKQNNKESVLEAQLAGMHLRLRDKLREINLALLKTRKGVLAPGHKERRK